jgi:hypothetical protein
LAPLGKLTRHDGIFGLNPLKGVAAERHAHRRLLHIDDSEDTFGELIGIARLSMVRTSGEVPNSSGGLRIIGYLDTADAQRASIQEVGAEEARLDDSCPYPQRPQLKRKCLRQSLDSKLGGAVYPHPADAAYPPIDETFST